MLSCIALGFILILLSNILKVKTTKESWTLTVLAIILSTFIVIIYTFLVILLIFWIYRSLVYIIAKIKYGRNFLGFVEGIDAIYASNCTSKNLTTVLLILHNKSKENIYEVVKEVIDLKILQNPKTLSKFQATFAKFMGYQCFVTTSVSLQDCVKKLPICENKEIDQNQLLDLLSECHSTPLPNNETVLWDVFVGVQRLQWKTDKNCYPIFVRVHDAIVHKTSLLKLFTEVFADSEIIETLSEHGTYKNSAKTALIKRILASCSHSLTSYFNGFNALLFSPSLLLEGFKYKGEERNIIHKPIFGEKQVFAVKVEELESDYVEKIKWIKRKISCTFSDVLITAFSESLKDYFQKHSPWHPEYLTSAVQIRPNNLNTTSTIFINLPLFFENDKDSLINRLNMLKTQTDFSHKTLEIQASYFLSNTACSMTPFSVVQHILENFQCSSTLCFVPGPQQVTFNKGKLMVLECCFWLPQRNSCGVNLTSMTYDNRLHFALNCDQIYIRNLDDVQELLEGILKNIDKLEKEILCTK